MTYFQRLAIWAHCAVVLVVVVVRIVVLVEVAAAVLVVLVIDIRLYDLLYWVEVYYHDPFLKPCCRMRIPSEFVNFPFMLDLLPPSDPQPPGSSTLTGLTSIRARAARSVRTLIRLDKSDSIRPLALVGV